MTIKHIPADDSDIQTLSPADLAAQITATAPPGTLDSGNGAMPRELTRAQTTELVDFFKSFGNQQTKIKLYRDKPALINGVPAAGWLEDFEFSPQLAEDFEERVKATHGGGTYHVQAHEATPGGGTRLGPRRTFQLPGLPIGVGIDTRGKERTPEDPGIANAALNFAWKMAEEARQAGQASGMPSHMLDALMRPLEAQIQSLNQQLAAKDDMLREKDRIIAEKDKLLSERPAHSGSTFQELMLTKMMDNESTKLQGLRDQYESERRMLMQSHADERSRIETRHDMEKQSLKDSHLREIDTLKTAMEARNQSREDRISDLNRELDRVNRELAELRARKDKSLLDSLREAKQMTNALTELGIGGEEDDDAIGGIMKMASPVIEALGQRMLTSPAQGQPAQLPAPQAQAQRRPGQPAQQRRPRPQPPKPAPTATVPVVAQPGSPTNFAERPGEGGPNMGTDISAVPDEPVTVEQLGLSRDDLGIAVKAMESAVMSGQTPQKFVEMFGQAVPPTVRQAVTKVGIDAVLNDVAQLEDTSPLHTQVGKQFARAVAKLLST